MSGSRLLVVGASYAGVHLAASARQHGWSGQITLVGEEPWLPYERPPLSKTFLASDETSDQLALRGETFYRRHDIELLRGARVTDVDHNRRQALLAGGDVLPYDVLALATGAAPCRLPVPGADLMGVRYLATLDDALALRSLLEPVRDVAVVGAGFVGLEIASTLAGLGRRVHVLEIAPRVLARVLRPAMSAYFASLHAAHGVEIRTSTACVEIVGEGGRAVGVRTDAGELVPADLVLVAVGSAPRTELADRLGAEMAGGVMVDSRMRTSVPGVVAAGDCASFVSPFAGMAAPLRLESVQNATDQGRVAGATVAGVDAEYDVPPWFWSDQYDAKLQLAGLHQPSTRDVIRGDVASGTFSVIHLDATDRVVAVDSVNAPADHAAARRLVGQRARLDHDLVADVAVPLKATVREPDPRMARL